MDDVLAAYAAEEDGQEVILVGEGQRRQRTDDGGADEPGA